MPLDRRRFLQLTTAAGLAGRLRAQPFVVPAQPLLRIPRYDQVTLNDGIAKDQQTNAQAILATFDDDALLKPFRVMGDLPAPGRELGGWYQYLPDYNWHTGDAGLAPGHCFGQWVSAMARFASAQNDAKGRERVLRLNRLFATSITPGFFERTRYPAYTLDKFNIGLLDAHTLLGDPLALATANKARECATGNLPTSALERDITWRKERDFSYTWDESYTLPENLYRLYNAGAGDLYRTMARAFLFDSFFGPLARNKNVLGTLHGYSHVNALGSAVQAYLVDGSHMHLEAALNGYRMIEAQTFASGGWAPDELFETPGSGKLLASLSDSHNTFETPCGTYALLKLSRSLLAVTRDGLYGDAMERILFNSMFGALPLQPDGRTFYYADMNFHAQRVYSAHRWPCCAGTFTQVAADYGINTYLLDPEVEPGVWVNLYLPSEIRFAVGNTSIQLTQSGSYPLAEQVSFQFDTERPTALDLHLRIPHWCSQPVVLINGQRQSLRLQQGFVTLRRTWHIGDRVELILPATLRLEAFPADRSPQPALAALCAGPLMLFPDQPGLLTAADLPQIQRVSPTEWRLVSRGLTFRPYFALGDVPYSTYLQTT